jgi:hypothetical protein
MALDRTIRESRQGDGCGSGYDRRGHGGTILEGLKERRHASRYDSATSAGKSSSTGARVSGSDPVKVAGKWRRLLWKIQATKEW